MKHVHEFTLTKTVWGDLRIVRPIPRNNTIWGELIVLKDTIWGQFIPTIAFETLDRALRGDVLPFLREAGYYPKDILQKLKKHKTETLCQHVAAKSCLLVDLKKCYPCADLPSCYVPPELTFEQRQLANYVALSWRDDKFVVVVEENT